MYCIKCGKLLDENASFCTSCGAKYSHDSSTNQSDYFGANSFSYTPIDQIPTRYMPLGAWSYFWLNVLFSIPFVGFIFLIIFSFSNSNINRRNFARSYWCIYVIYAIIALLFIGAR
ncbi:MAG: zinc-ribbon domain-containing protein [Clostridia bacterium]|nr:zinc-ribbon domain-containing protein [Clostridia bacterium]